VGSTDYSSTSTWYAQIIQLYLLFFITLPDDEVLELQYFSTDWLLSLNQMATWWCLGRNIGSERQRASRGTHLLMMTWSFVSELVAKGSTLSDVIVFVLVRMNSSI
jgi:hypothetical protein